MHDSRNPKESEDADQPRAFLCPVLVVCSYHYALLVLEVPKSKSIPLAWDPSNVLGTGRCAKSTGKGFAAHLRLHIDGKGFWSAEKRFCGFF